MPVNTQSHTYCSVGQPVKPATTMPGSQAETMNEASEAAEPRGGQAEPADPPPPNPNSLFH